MAENNAQPFMFPIQDTYIIDTASVRAFSFQSSHYELPLEAGVYSPMPVQVLPDRNSVYSGKCSLEHQVAIHSSHWPLDADVISADLTRNSNPESQKLFLHWEKIGFC